MDLTPQNNSHEQKRVKREPYFLAAPSNLHLDPPPPVVMCDLRSFDSVKQNLEAVKTFFQTRETNASSATKGFLLEIEQIQKLNPDESNLGLICSRMYRVGNHLEHFVRNAPLAITDREELSTHLRCFRDNCKISYVHPTSGETPEELRQTLQLLHAHEPQISIQIGIEFWKAHYYSEGLVPITFETLKLPVAPRAEKVSARKPLSEEDRAWQSTYRNKAITWGSSGLLCLALTFLETETLGNFLKNGFKIGLIVAGVGTLCFALKSLGRPGKH